MGRFLKILLLLVAGLAGLLVIAAVSLTLFFDPNDFRDRIAAEVKESTGRDLVVGDVDLNVFPWLAVQLGPTSLGNADGFSGDAFLSFDSASLSVRIMPLLFNQEVQVGTASLDGLNVNLEVRSDGVTNWDDLSEGGDAGPAGEDDGAGTTIDVANISVTNANVAYADGVSGTAYAISNFSFETGRIASGAPFPIDAEFDFSSTPGGTGGDVAMRGTVTMSEGAERVTGGTGACG